MREETLFPTEAITGPQTSARLESASPPPRAEERGGAARSAGAGNVDAPVAAPQAQAIGLAYIAPHREGITGLAVGALYGAGPVVHGRGGLTLTELAEAVGRKRGKRTERTSLCQSLKDLRGEDREGNVVNAVYVFDSGQLRDCGSGTRQTIWCHIAHRGACK